MAKRGTLNHPKNQRLAKALRTGPGVTLGLLETLWEWASIYKPTGLLTFADLEEAFDYGKWRLTFKDYAKVVDALSEAKHRWLDPIEDGSFIIHDWPDHANDSVHAKLYREVSTFADGTRPLPKKIGKREKEKLAGLWAKFEGAACQTPPPAAVGQPTGHPSLTHAYALTHAQAQTNDAAAVGPPVPECVFLGRGGEEAGVDPLHGFTPLVKTQAVALMGRYVEHRFGTEANVPASYDRKRDLRDSLASTLEARPDSYEKLQAYFDKPALPRNAPLFKVILHLGLGIDVPNSGKRNHDPPPLRIDQGFEAVESLRNQAKIA